MNMNMNDNTQDHHHIIDFDKETSPRKIIFSEWHCTAKESWIPGAFTSTAFQACQNTMLEVCLQDTLDDTFHGTMQGGRTMTEMSFLHLIQLLSSKETSLLIKTEKYYLCQCSFMSTDDTQPAVLPALEQDWKMPRELSTVNVHQLNLWISIQDTQSNLHYDAYHNVLIVLHGRKHVRLYPPSETPYLDAVPIFANFMNHSNLPSPYIPHGDIKALEFEIKAGEALFIPEGWWHQVNSDPCTVAVNVWFSGMRAKLMATPHMHDYYVRVLLEDMLRQNRISTLNDFITSQKKIKLPPWTTVDTLLDCLTASSPPCRETYLMQINPSELNLTLQKICTYRPNLWQSILSTISMHLVEYLTEHWEKETADESLYAQLFYVDENEDDYRQMFLDQKSQFAQTVFQKTLLTHFQI